eukprot:TRINITY_DN4676_c0_g1_i3.p1 TRINITY_DN4676_c0_g1~~TRINITY_DN4676_c0_g1_i3.p1  ORF type:complete len:1617 (-),score=447.89 TRINITY_DN4676_c0_g1_i3:198-5048(-)
MAAANEESTQEEKSVEEDRRDSFGTSDRVGSKESELPSGSLAASLASLPEREEVEAALPDASRQPGGRRAISLDAAVQKAPSVPSIPDLARLGLVSPRSRPRSRSPGGTPRSRSDTSEASPRDGTSSRVGKRIASTSSIKELLLQPGDDEGDTPRSGKKFWFRKRSRSGDLHHAPPQPSYASLSSLTVLGAAMEPNKQDRGNYIGDFAGSFDPKQLSWINIPMILRCAILNHHEGVESLMGKAETLATSVNQLNRTQKSNQEKNIAEIKRLRQTLETLWSACSQRRGRRRGIKLPPFPLALASMGVPDKRGSTGTQPASTIIMDRKASITELASSSVGGPGQRRIGAQFDRQSLVAEAVYRNTEELGMVERARHHHHTDAEIVAQGRARPEALDASPPDTPHGQGLEAHHHHQRHAMTIAPAGSVHGSPRSPFNEAEATQSSGGASRARRVIRNSIMAVAAFSSGRFSQGSDPERVDTDPEGSPPLSPMLTRRRASEQMSEQPELHRGSSFGARMSIITDPRMMGEAQPLLQSRQLTPRGLSASPLLSPSGGYSRDSHAMARIVSAESMGANTNESDGFSDDSEDGMTKAQLQRLEFLELNMQDLMQSNAELKANVAYLQKSLAETQEELNRASEDNLALRQHVESQDDAFLRDLTWKAVVDYLPRWMMFMGVTPDGSQESAKTWFLFIKETLGGLQKFQKETSIEITKMGNWKMQQEARGRRVDITRATVSRKSLSIHARQTFRQGSYSTSASVNSGMSVNNLAEIAFQAVQLHRHERSTRKSTQNALANVANGGGSGGGSNSGSRSGSQAPSRQVSGSSDDHGMRAIAEGEEEDDKFSSEASSSSSFMPPPTPRSSIQDIQANLITNGLPGLGALTEGDEETSMEEGSVEASVQEPARQISDDSLISGDDDYQRQETDVTLYSNPSEMGSHYDDSLADHERLVDMATLKEVLKQTESTFEKFTNEMKEVKQQVSDIQETLKTYDKNLEEKLGKDIERAEDELLDEIDEIGDKLSGRLDKHDEELATFQTELNTRMIRVHAELDKQLERAEDEMSKASDKLMQSVSKGLHWLRDEEKRICTQVSAVFPRALLQAKSAKDFSVNEARLFTLDTRLEALEVEVERLQETSGEQEEKEKTDKTRPEKDKPEKDKPEKEKEKERDKEKAKEKDGKTVTIPGRKRGSMEEKLRSKDDVWARAAKEGSPLMYGLGAAREVSPEIQAGLRYTTTSKRASVKVAIREDGNERKRASLLATIDPDVMLQDVMTDTLRKRNPAINMVAKGPESAGRQLPVINSERNSQAQEALAAVVDDLFYNMDSSKSKQEDARQQDDFFISPDPPQNDRERRRPEFLSSLNSPESKEARRQDFLNSLDSPENKWSPREGKWSPREGKWSPREGKMLSRQDLSMNSVDSREEKHEGKWSPRRQDDSMNSQEDSMNSQGNQTSQGKREARRQETNASESSERWWRSQSKRFGTSSSNLAGGGSESRRGSKDRDDGSSRGSDEASDAADRRPSGDGEEKSEEKSDEQASCLERTLSEIARRHTLAEAKQASLEKQASFEKQVSFEKQASGGDEAAQPQPPTPPARPASAFVRPGKRRQLQHQTTLEKLQAVRKQNQ